MTSNNRRLAHSSDAKEAEIHAGIARDADNPELTDEQLASLRPAQDVLPRALFEALVKRARGRPRLDQTSKKVVVKLRVDPDVLEALKAGGPGWQTRMNELLKHAVNESGSKRARSR